MKAITTTVLPLWMQVVEILDRKPAQGEVWTVELIRDQIHRIRINYQVVWENPSLEEV